MPTIDELEGWMTTGQVSQRLGRSREGTLTLARDRRLRAVYVGGKYGRGVWIYDPESVDAFRREKKASKHRVEVVKSGEYMYVIGMGNKEDWNAGRGSLYYIEDKSEERAIPVFTTPEKLDIYLRANLDTVTAHMSMLESVGVLHSKPMTKGRIIAMPLDNLGLAKAVEMIDANYLIRDPRPGRKQEIMRLTKGEYDAQ